MLTEAKLKQKQIPRHVAIILDGNGRWAKKRMMPRSYGHEQGALNVKRVAELCKALGVEVLSVYGFSTENWQRPKDEVDFLMDLPKRFQERYDEDTLEEKVKMHDIKVVFSGRRDRFNDYNRQLINEIETKTKDQTAFTLNVCVDYGSQHEIITAAKGVAKDVQAGALELDQIDESRFETYLYTKDLPPVDLLIRTSGEQRLSNYLLWQNAYAEFYFTKTHWPAFRKKALYKAIKAYQNRNRKFGKVGT